MDPGAFSTVTSTLSSEDLRVAQPNDPRRPDPRRERCEELAQRLATDSGLETARLLQASGFLAQPLAPEPPPKQTPEDGDLRPISIWRPRRLDDEWVFERPELLPLGDHHSARRRFPAAKRPGAIRVCFFGESVAAGYLYAPHLTPTAVLAQQLAHFAPDLDFEIIDLARTNERLGPLTRTAEASLQLEPQRWVFFVGNNWPLLETPEVSPFFPSVVARQEVAAELRRNDLDGPPELSARRLEIAVRSTFARLARQAEANDVEVILVVPESHLAGWEVAQPVPWLPGDDAARWHEEMTSCQGRLAEGDGPEAEAAAHRLLAIDGGRCPTGHRLLARALLLQSEVDAARQAAQEAVDRAAYPLNGCLASPQATSTVQGLLRRAAAEHGFRIVDLPWIFAAQEDDLPGDELFLDYCHLSAEGMRRAMAGVTGELLDLEGRPHDLEELLTRAPQPTLPRAVAATAHLGAAVHGAHRRLSVADDGHPPLRYHLRRALEIDPRIAATCVDLALARAASPHAAVLTSAQSRNLASPHRLLLQHGWRWDHLDADLLQVLLEVLNEHNPEACEPVHQTLLHQHAVERRPRDLARPPYPWQPLARLYPEAMDTADASRRLTLRSPWPQTSFCLVTQGDHDLLLTPVLRLSSLPGATERNGEARILLNGEALITLDLDTQWSRMVLRLPKRLLHPVLNRITLEWPALPAVGDEAFSEAVHELEMGREGELFPIFGEVAALEVRAAR